LQHQFAETALAQFGNGWAWLVLENGRLKVMKTSNAVNPLATHGISDLRCVGTCLLPRLSESPADFVKAFMEQLINWDFVAQNMSCQHGYGRRVIPGTIPAGRTLTISSGERVPRPPLFH
jgi:superoxide dismutase